MGYGKRAGNFYKCHCQNYKGIGYLTVCKKCTDGLFEKYLQSCADAKLAMRQLCRKLDLYWSEEAYNYVFMRNVTKNLVSAYMVKIGTGSYVGKSYDVFGDGSLLMVNIPGHSEGLCALKIKNADGKYVLLFADGGYATKSWRDMITSGITLDKKMQHQSLQWIREQSMSPDCIASLATHDTDVQPHVIEL